MNNERKTTPIFIPQEVKKIVELNKGIGKNELGKSLIDLLEDSPKYRKLKAIRSQIVSQLDPESVSIEDVLSPHTKGLDENSNTGVEGTLRFGESQTKEDNIHSEVSYPMESPDDIQTNCPLRDTSEDFSSIPQKNEEVSP